MFSFPHPPRPAQRNPVPKTRRKHAARLREADFEFRTLIQPIIDIEDAIQAQRHAEPFYRPTMLNE